METYMADDTVAPTVTITAVAGTGDNAGKVVFKFTFSEPLAARFLYVGRPYKRYWCYVSRESNCGCYQQ